MDWNAKTAQVCWSPRMYWCSENPRPSEASTTASSPAAPLGFVNIWWMESLWCYRDEVGFLLAGQEWNNLFGTGSFTTSVFGNVLKEQTSQRSSWHTTASKGVRRVLRCVGFSWFSYMFPHIFYIIQLLTLQGSSLRLHDFTIQGPNHNPRDSWELEGQVLLAWCPLRTSRPLVIEWVGSICELRMFLQWVLGNVCWSLRNSTLLWQRRRFERGWALLLGGGLVYPGLPQCLGLQCAAIAIWYKASFLINLTAKAGTTIAMEWDREDLLATLMEIEKAGELQRFLRL